MKDSTLLEIEERQMIDRSLWRFIILAGVVLGLAVASARAQITNLGSLNINMAVTWDTPDMTNRTDVLGWNCWVYPQGTTNGSPLLSFFLSTNYVTNNISAELPGQVVYCPGQIVMGNISNGPKVLGVSTVAQAGLLGPTNYCQVYFNNGQLSLNSHVRVWEFITATGLVNAPPAPIP